MNEGIVITDDLLAYLRKNFASRCPLVAKGADAMTMQCAYGEFVAQLLVSEELSPDTYISFTSNRPKYGAKSMSSPNPDRVFSSGGTKQVSYRVKDTSEAYSEKRYEAKHIKTNQPVLDTTFQENCLTQSEASRARAGTFFKHLANRSGLLRSPLSEHEQGLLADMVHKHAWCGTVGSDYYESIQHPNTVKALIDDTTSGGTEIVPIELDRDLITFPLLTGELFPLVDVKPVSQGRRIMGGAISNPTLTWEGGDNNAITLFSTGSMINPVDTTVFVIDGAVTIGRDFLSDTPIEVGTVLTGLVGQSLAAALDKVVALGNGTNQPEGIFEATGLSTVTPVNSGGAQTLTDYYALLFALGKQYRSDKNNVVFVSNDTTYQRSRSIPVGTANALPVMDILNVASANKYETVGWPHKIQNDIPNASCGFVAMNRYRMYRRLGLDIRFEQGGITLAQNNLILMVYRARFGGRMTDANAAVKWIAGQP
jgi:HK97 family phage major capsid protein